MSFTKLLFRINFIILTISFSLIADHNIDLNNYISYAIKNNPGVKARFHQWQASEIEIGYVNKLPNPKLNAGYFIKNIETAVGPQEYKVGISQMIPFFGKLKLKKTIQSYKTEIKKQIYLDFIDEMSFDIKSIFYDICFINQSILITKQKIDLVNQNIKILKSKYISANKSQKDILKSEQELSRLREEFSALKRNKKSLLISFKYILNDESMDSIFIEKLSLPNSTIHNIDSLESILLQNNRQLTIQKMNQEIASLLVKKSKQNYIPDFGIGIDYILTGEKYKTDGSKVDMSGKDPMLLMFSMDIPIQLRKISSDIKASQSNQKSSQENIKALENKLISELNVLTNKHENLHNKIYLYENELIPISTHTLQVIEKDYITGKSDYLNLLDQQKELFKYQLAKEKTISEYYKVESKIQKLIGDK